MRVRVTFHSWFREEMGHEELEMELPEGSTLEDLLGRLREEHPRWTRLEGSALTAVNLEYRKLDHRLSEGDEAALFPPVQGGRG